MVCARTSAHGCIHDNHDSHDSQDNAGKVWRGHDRRLEEGERMAAKGKENRILVTLACTECKRRNYITTKNKKNDPDRMELRKFCPYCRCQRPHRETK